jgi:hypothetical protein
MQAYDGARPSEEFAKASRERFRIATGERISEAFDIEPPLSFFAAARVKFLMAAQKMRLGERARPRRHIPVFGTTYRALASAAAAFVLFAGFSGYTVASAADSLPGDWQYPVKLQTERVRLALAFSEDAKRDVRLDIAAERVEEIERLTRKGRIIGPGVIDRLKDDTEPLADDLYELDAGELERVHAITEKSRNVLDNAAGQIAPEAQPALEETKAFVDSVATEAGVLAINRRGPGALITPQIALQTPEPTNTPEPTATPEVSATAEAPPEASATPAREALTVDTTPVGVDRGVTWIRLSTGLFSTLIPSPQDGWNISGVSIADGSSPAPKLIRLYNTDGTQIITLNPKNGDAYWFVAINGVFDEVQLRITRDGQTFVTDRDLVVRLYGPLADVPLYVIDHIEFETAPPPTPEPTATSEHTAVP